MSRCPCDECNISHMITCGLISPEVSEHHRHHHHHHSHDDGTDESQQAAEHNSSHLAASDDTLQLSPSRIPRPLSCHNDQLRQYYAAIKPPSIPSSSDSSCSESPIILDRCRFFGEDFEYETFHLSMIIFIYKAVWFAEAPLQVDRPFVRNPHFKTLARWVRDVYITELCVCSLTYSTNILMWFVDLCVYMYVLKVATTATTVDVIIGDDICHVYRTQSVLVFLSTSDCNLWFQSLTPFISFSSLYNTTFYLNMEVENWACCVLH